MCIDLTVCHLPICQYSFSLGFMSDHELHPTNRLCTHISYQMSNSISSSLVSFISLVIFLLSLPFPTTACVNCTSTSPSAIVAGLLQQYWNLSHCFQCGLTWETYVSDTKFVSEKQKCFRLEAKIFLVFRAANFFRN